MRAVIPADHSDRQAGQLPAPAGGTCFNLRLPLGILKKRNWLRFCVAKDTDSGKPESQATPFRQVILTLTTKALIATLLLIVLVEAIFILYLVKCLFGIDFFPDFHLLS